MTALCLEPTSLSPIASPPTPLPTPLSSASLTTTLGTGNTHLLSIETILLILLLHFHLAFHALTL